MNLPLTRRPTLPDDVCDEPEQAQKSRAGQQLRCARFEHALSAAVKMIDVHALEEGCVRGDVDVPRGRIEHHLGETPLPIGASIGEELIRVQIAPGVTERYPIIL